MSGRLVRLREEFRQRRHYRAFRIAPPVWDEPPREELERLLAAVAASADATEPQPDANAEPESEPGRMPHLDEKALAEAATNLWRAQRRLTRQGEEASTRSRQTGRYLRTCREALTDAGLSVHEHEGDAFHTGRSLDVLVFEDDPSLTTETVLETVRPTVYLHGRRIQMGQVIVGCPTPDSQAQDSWTPDTKAPSSSDQERTDHA